MHADHFVGTLGEGGNFGDRDRRGVRGENDFGLRDAVEIAEDFGFDFKFFGGRFDDEIAARLVETRSSTDLMRLSVAVLSSAVILSFGNFAIEVLSDRREAAIQKALFNIA